MGGSRKRSDLVDESSVLITLAALRTGTHQFLQTPESQRVLDAICRSTSELKQGASIDAISHYVGGFDDHQLPGLINNIKGITFEMAYVNHENSDHDHVHAELQPDTNHPATDVRLIDDHSGHVSEVQLKATDSQAYVHDFMQNHPGVHVVTTSEVAGHVAGVSDGGFGNAHLTNQVKSTIDDLRHPNLHQAAPFIAAGLAASIRAAPVVWALAKGRIDKKAAGRKLLSNCAPAALRAAGLAVALHSPLAPLAGAYILFRVARRGFQSVAFNLKPVEDEE